MSFDPYLYFDGTCRQAMTWYAEVFGGTLSLMTYAEAPAGPDMPKMESGGIMHACVTVDGRMLMASDYPPGMEAQVQSGVSVSHGSPTRAEAQALFARLAEGGRTIMPFGDVFWCDGFGMVTDRFGTSWLIGGPARM